MWTVGIRTALVVAVLVCAAWAAGPRSSAGVRMDRGSEAACQVTPAYPSPPCAQHELTALTTDVGSLELEQEESELLPAVPVERSVAARWCAAFPLSLSETLFELFDPPPEPHLKLT